MRECQLVVPRQLDGLHRHLPVFPPPIGRKVIDWVGDRGTANPVLPGGDRRVGDRAGPESRQLLVAW